MSSSYYFSTQINIICLIVFLIIGIYIIKSGDRSRVAFLTIVCLSALLSLFDMLMRINVNENCGSLYLKVEYCIANSNFVIFLTCVHTFLLLLIPFIVCVYSFYLRFLGNKKIYVLNSLWLFITFVVMAYFIISSPANGYILFTAFNGVFIHGRFFYILVLVVSLYSVLGIINSLQFIASKKDRFLQVQFNRFEYSIFFLSVLIPFAFAPLSLVYDGPLLNVAYAISSLYFMTVLQHLRISIDELTNLNNINQLRRYLDKLMLIPDKKRRNTFLIFIDVNKFKVINDKFGHNEGDIVLVQISKLLKVIAINFNCFICRYGGDEFILIKQNANEEKASSICKYINKSLKSLKTLSLAEYDLSVSTGFVRFDRRFNSTQEFINAADKLMYETKRSTKKDYNKIKLYSTYDNVSQNLFNYSGEKDKFLEVNQNKNL